MASSSTAALSRTLKTITLTKINELEKQRQAYAKSKGAILESASENVGQHDRILHLLRGVEALGQPSGSAGGLDTSNVRRWVEQSQFDASVPDTMLSGFEDRLRSHLDVQTRKLDLAALYSRLLTEWLTAQDAGAAVTEETSSSDGSFELVEEDRLKELQEKFQGVVFTPLETATEDITQHLQSLFGGALGAKSLERLRRSTASRGSSIMNNKAPFDERSINWCLKGLLANDLLREDKKAILQDFLQDKVARGEICDVLNMKFADIKNWTWDAPPEGLPVEPRSQLNGKYRIMMDEDVLDAIFLHYIGMMWSSGTHDDLFQFVSSDDVWTKSSNVSQDVRDRRKYFLGDSRSFREANSGLDKARHDMFFDDFFLSQLPASVHEGAGGYDDEDMVSDCEDFEKKTPKEIKQQLLRLLASEVHLHTFLNGECAVVQSDFQWFGAALPHSTIYAVLEFAGVDQEWIAFIRRFLEAPLDMSPVLGNKISAGRIRKRGTPMAHALEKFIGELVLFFMDLAVNQQGGTLLYRFHDDLWLVGEPAKCANAWQTMEKFAKVMGLDFNESKTGSVLLTKEADFSYEDSEVAAKLPIGPVNIGFLTLHPTTGSWVINQKDVDAHVKQLSKQLAHSSSILSWVQTWNSCIGRFFSHTFGEPANCFGREHVDAILNTYKRMQEAIFPDSNVSTYLKDMITERFGITDVPDAFIFLPESLGGLGVRNPFISPLLVRENVTDPKAAMIRYLSDERETYENLKRAFELHSIQARKTRLRTIYRDEDGNINDPNAPTSLAEFMTFEDFTAARESTSPELTLTYNDLMRKPSQKRTATSTQVDRTISFLVEQAGTIPVGMEAEMRWLLQMYEGELLAKCGGMSLVEKNLLPLGVLTILRKKRVAWQMVL